MKKYNNEKAIISLTSWVKRISFVSKTIYNLLTICPGFHIVLTLSEEEFPNKMNDLPEDLLLFVENDLIEILWVKENYKSFKKWLFTAQKYPKVPIITADDDCIYFENYAETLYNNWLNSKNKNTFISYYVNYIDNIPHLGGACTLYPPNIFNDIGINLLIKSKIYKITNQDDDFYTALRKLLNLTTAKCVGNYKKLYCFHDEISPCHNELRKMSNLTRKKRLNQIFNLVKESNF